MMRNLRYYYQTKEVDTFGACITVASKRNEYKVFDGKLEEAEW